MPNETTAFASSHRQKKTWLTVLAVLAVLVVFATVAALTMPASAMTAPATPETAASGETAAPESSALPQDNAAPSDTAQSDTVTEQAAAETAALPTAAQVPEDYTVQRTVRDEANGFAVTVYAPDGVIPEDAALSATLLTEGDEAYQQAEQALAEETDGRSYGFAALDIHLEDAEGNEVEPQGDVFVSIDAIGLLPEDADPDSVTVQHHAEQGDETAAAAVTVETVADAADETEGVVEVTPAADATESATTLEAPEGEPATEMQAAFTVDGFSTFTIYWRERYDDPLTIQIINTNGASIGNKTIGWDRIDAPTSIDDIVSVIANENDSSIDNYAFSRAVVANSADAAINSDISVERIRRESENWQYNTSSSGGSWTDIGSNSLYFVYSDSEEDNPDFIQTADTISAGITINLFDYNARNSLTSSQGCINTNHALSFTANTYGHEGSDIKDRNTSGDYVILNGYVAGTSGLKNIVSNTLAYLEGDDNGYPQVSYEGITENLAYLFDPDYEIGNGLVAKYNNLNHLFTQNGSMYSYNSSENFATISGQSRNDDGSLDFVVYNEANPAGSVSDPLFLPLNEYGTQKSDDDTNYHFGMTVSTDFMMPYEGQVDGQDMIFTFSGDDDVWVYIDDVLVLDLGGIHDSMSGSINFTTGQVQIWLTANEDANGNVSSYITNTTIQKCFTAAGGNWDSSSYSTHTFDFFYLERGGSGSNCEIEFNLYTLQQNSLRVGKEVATTTETTEEINDWLGNLQYTFRVLYAGVPPTTTDPSELFIQPGTRFDIYNAQNQDTGEDGTVGTDGTFVLRAGQYAVFTGIDEDSGSYYVQELVESEYSQQFGNVIVSTNPAGGTVKFVDKNGAIIDGEKFAGVVSSVVSASQVGFVEFTNQVDTTQLSLLTITKAAAAGSSFDENDTFRVYAEIDGEPVDGSFGPSDAQVTFTNGFATFHVGTTVSIPVLTGANFTIYEVGGEGYEVTYTAAQTFPEDKGGAYTLTEVKTEDGVETVQGEVGDLEHTTNVEGVTDATGATMAVTLTNKKTSADLTIVKNIYGLNAEQVVHLVNGDYSKETCDNNDDHIRNHKHGLRFDVDYFNAKESAIEDNYKDKDSFIDDWTFDVQRTLTKKNAENEDDSFISDNAAWSGDINEDGVDMDTQGQEDDQAEVKHYQNSSLTYVVPAEGEPYYQYTITIQDVELTDWYHVMETRTTVDGYDLAASVATTVTGTGTEISNLIEDNNGTKTAFQLTGDTTVTFTNRYTHNTVTVNMKKVESGSSNGLAGAKFYLYYTETQGNTSTRYYYQAPAAGEEEAKWLEQTNDDEVPAGATQIVSGPDGALQVPGLAVDREYTLQEVEAPAGYQLPTNTILIRVGADGLVTVKYANGEGVAFTVAEGADKPDSSTKPWDPADITYLIPNTTGAELPATGGAGTTFLTCSGLLMMAAAVGGYALRRRRGKGAR